MGVQTLEAYHICRQVNGHTDSGTVVLLPVQMVHMGRPMCQTL
jgi:hypothetical protein